MRSKHWLPALAFLLACSVAQAQETKTEGRQQPEHSLLGLETHPYVAIEFDRLSGLGEWSTGLSGGLEIDLDPLWFGASYTLHDILTSSEVYPWDGTFVARLGVYQGGVGKLISIPSYAHAAILLARPSGPDEWSAGFEAGAEFDVAPLYLGITYTLHDILTTDSDEELDSSGDSDVYPWDATFALSLGAYW